MSELIVVGFDDEVTADQVLLDLTRQQSGYRIDPEAAAVVIRKADGELVIKQAHALVAAMGAHGSFWGLLIGILLLNPLAGVVIGGAVGATIGFLRHLGIEDSFLRSLGANAKPGTSMLFLLEHEASPTSVYNELKRFDGRVLKTSFSFVSETKLRESLDAARKYWEVPADREGQ